MDVIIAVNGSYGDVYPMLGIGVTLKKRGHSVTVLANDHFQRNIRSMGLGFSSTGSMHNYTFMLNNSDTIKGLCEISIQPMRPVFEHIAQNYIPGETVMLTNGSLGVSLAHEKFDIPMISLNIMPLLFFSSCDPPLFTYRPYPSWLPRRIFQGLWQAFGLVFDYYWRPAINELRKENGMPPQPRGVGWWMQSPQKIIGLFPDWFSKPQPDWPRHSVLTGFPLFDEGGTGQTALPEDLEAFLRGGAPPIIVTPGTPNKNYAGFFQKAVQAVNAIGARAIFVTTHPEQVPDDLPENIRFYNYLPFSQVFPRASLLVHHGGIGTMAQAMRAGLPHLVTPWGNDQFDNGAKIKALGLGEVINTKTCTVKKLAEKMQFLLESPDVKAQCRNTAQLLRKATPLEDTCRIIEETGLRYLADVAVGTWRIPSGKPLGQVRKYQHEQLEDHV